ncbi:MAG: hypothetical protein Q9201_007679 [Fulgogasparrea decipioides]
MVTLTDEKPSSKTTVSELSEDDVKTLVPSPEIPRGARYHIWKAENAGAKITKPDMTPLYSVTGFGSSHTPRMIITNPANENEILVNLTSHSSVNKEDSYIEIEMAGVQDASTGHTFKLQRDKGALKRIHKMTLSDGKTYVLKGKHSSSLMWCWGNLKIVEEGNKVRLAEFTVEWPSSFHKIGIVTFETEVEESVAKEMLFAILGVVNKEYIKGMAGMSMGAATI